MSQYPWAQPPNSWPGSPQTRFDPADPLISDHYAGWWRRSFALLRAGWRPMATLQLLLAVPVLAILIPTEIAYDRQERALQSSLDPGQTADIGAALRPGLTLLAGTLPVGVILALGVLAVVHLATVIATGGSPRVGDALRAALRRMPAMLGWSVVAVGIGIVAFLLCVLPSIYVGAVLTVLPVVVHLERGNAVSRCFRLFHADLGASIARVATIGGLAIAFSAVGLVLTLIAALAVHGSAAFDPSVPVSTGSSIALGVVNGVLETLSYLLSGVVLTPLLVTAYADMRARREPFNTAYLARPAAPDTAGA